MTHQQTNTRRRAARFATANPTLSSLSSVRKGAIRGRSRFQYSTEMEKMDEMDYARSIMSSGVRNSHDGSSDLRSIANVQKLSMLQEIFPDVAVDVMEDVLIAAQFRVDVAASMLGDVTREFLKGSDSPESPDLVVVDWTGVQHADEWHEVSESRPEMEQWIMIQDEWEVVDSDIASPQKTRSYADVLSSNAHETPVALPPVARARVSTSLAPLVRQKKMDDEADDMVEMEELSIKSFGARKRRASRKFRG